METMNERRKQRIEKIEEEQSYMVSKFSAILVNSDQKKLETIAEHGTYLGPVVKKAENKARKLDDPDLSVIVLDKTGQIQFVF